MSLPFFLLQNVTHHSGILIASMVGHVSGFQARRRPRTQVPIAFARWVLKGKIFNQFLTSSIAEQYAKIKAAGCSELFSSKLH